MRVTWPHGFMSWLSYASVWSTGSTASLSSFLCILGIVSFGSISSYMSVASTASVLSVASSSSFMSVGSVGCSFRYLDDCQTKVVHPITTSVDIVLPEATFDTMETCSRDEYEMEERPQKCDYQAANCTYTTSNSNASITAECEVRRKGFSTWRAMRGKPSFKVKNFNEDDDGVLFGEFPCGNNCPGGTSSNMWRSEKFTLNNQVQEDGEIDAYETFRAFIPAPMAFQTTVRLYRGDELVKEDTYAMLETIDDKAFMEKWFGEPYALYEVENDEATLERDDGFNESVEPLETESTLQSILALGLSDLNRYNILYYFAGEVVTRHWDGGCLREKQNNYYVAYNGTDYFYIPSGVDQTFQCSPANAAPIFNYNGDFNTPVCKPMVECLDTSSCHEQYEAVLESVKTATARKVDCPDWMRIVLVSVLIPPGMTLALRGIWRLYAKSPIHCSLLHRLTHFDQNNICI